MRMDLQQRMILGTMRTLRRLRVGFAYPIRSLFVAHSPAAPGADSGTRRRPTDAADMAPQTSMST